MKPGSYRVTRGADFDVEGEIRQYVVDFLLDCLGVWIEFRDQEGMYEVEIYRANKVIEELKSLLTTITTFPKHSLVEKVRVDTELILALMIEQLSFLSDDKLESGLQLIKKNLKQYLG